MRGAALGLLVVAVAGCGGPGKVTLSGNVTVGGKPLESGAVMVRGPSGSVVVGGVQNGRYEVGSVPAGLVKLAVTEAMNTTGSTGGTAGGPAAGRTPAAPGKSAATGDGKAAGKGRIPPEYQDPDKTPLSHNTSEGTTRDIAIP